MGVVLSSHCHECGKATQDLTQRGIAYTEKNVGAAAAIACAAVVVSGQHGVPIITVVSQVIVGFQRRALDHALGLAALEARKEAAVSPAQDTLADLIAAQRLRWTADQATLVDQLRQRLASAALGDHLGRQLDYSFANCDDTFRHVRAFLAAHPYAAAEVAALLGLLGPLDVGCDCGYAINLRG